MQIPLTDPQMEFVTTDSLRPAIIGGLGSGKSRGGTMRLIKLMLETPSANGAYYMPSYDLLRLRALVGIEEDLQMLGIPYTTNKSEYTVRIHGYGDIILRSYDRPERIIAYEVAHSIVDELDTIPKDKAAEVWRKVNERNRQRIEGVQNSIGCVTTPDGGHNGFIYKRWVKQGGKEYQLIKAPTYSNPYLPDDYIDQIRANYDPVMAELYIEGEFVSLSESKVYHFFNRKEHHTDRVIEDTDKVLHIGLDFNIGGCCAVVFVIDNNMPIAVDEFVSHDTYDFVNNLTRYDGKKVIIYPDASGKAGRTNATMSDIGIIENAGYRVDAPRSNPAVRDRINAVNALLSHNTMRVNTDKCQEFTHSLESQGYTDKNEPEKYNDHPAIDDWNDAGGYFISQKYPVIKPVSGMNIRMAY